VLGRGRGIRWLHQQNDALAVAAYGVRMRFVHVDHDARHGRIRAVQTDANTLHPIGVQQEMFLFRV
jgi:hypothetical protein